MKILFNLKSMVYPHHKDIIKKYREVDNFLRHVSNVTTYVMPESFKKALDESGVQKIEGGTDATAVFLLKEGMIIYEEQNEKTKISISVQGKVFLLSGGYEKQYIKEKVNPIKRDLLTGFNVLISALTVAFSVYTLIGYESKLDTSQTEIKEIRKELNLQTLEAERTKNNESRMTNQKQKSEIHYYIFPHNSSTHTKIDSIAAQNRP